MEFRLNKIDTDIRKKMQEKIKTDKIHENAKISVRKDITEDKNKGKSNDKENDTKKAKKRFYTVDGIKYEGVLEIEVQKEQFLDKENYKGIKLDVKK
ncbi:hypothetical protein BJV38_000380 [Clostridium beijerinckii]|uniref:hypothetical protein n=1 Tax=Clostridium beijerinckii TaxID=1520 RepID=UPI0015711A02|nr:hypothetical protein [Clostridium beijerinckii]NRT37029.1 hypothetical protein [Clostridium beijerinckii]NRT43537.1 hypothetical protein [Clostridium beijerinckii]NRZ22471.1 hypothetical protein [Clostridium beijerinckii]